MTVFIHEINVLSKTRSWRSWNVGTNAFQMLLAGLGQKVISTFLAVLFFICETHLVQFRCQLWLSGEKEAPHAYLGAASVVTSRPWGGLVPRRRETAGPGGPRAPPLWRTEAGAWGQRPGGARRGRAFPGAALVWGGFAGQWGREVRSGRAMRGNRAWGGWGGVSWGGSGPEGVDAWGAWGRYVPQEEVAAVHAGALVSCGSFPSRKMALRCRRPARGPGAPPSGAGGGAACVAAGPLSGSPLEHLRVSPQRISCSLGRSSV